MKLIDELRRENLKHLRQEFGGLRQLSEKLEREDSQVSQWILGSKNSGTGKPRGMRSDTARFIEERCGVYPGWLDHDHSQDLEAAQLAQASPPLPHNVSNQAPAQQAPAWGAININSHQPPMTQPRDVIVALAALLAGLDPGRLASVTGMLQDLARKPTDDGLIDALASLVNTRPFAQPQQRKG